MLSKVDPGVPKRNRESIDALKMIHLTKRKHFALLLSAIATGNDRQLKLQTGTYNIGHMAAAGMVATARVS